MFRNLKTSRFPWSVLVTLGLLVTGSAFGQFTIPGSYSVSDTGAATYSIPLTVPPGIAGVSPQLSLAYSSQAGNGMLGVGFSLNGLSAITRCPNTPAHTGVVRAVQPDDQDRFCLDGDYLVATAGTYGGDGTTYTTEHETFSKIQSFWQAGTTGPAYFVVKTKDGLTAEYGRTADARVNFVGSTLVRVWSQNKTQDLYNNGIATTYVLDAAAGQNYPSKLTSTTSPTAWSVEFDYQTRGDVLTQFVGDAPVRMTKIMTAIRTTSNGQPVLTYVLNYNAGNVNVLSGRSLLTSVVLQSKSGAQLIPTAFNWSRGNDRSGTFVDRGALIGGSGFGASLWDTSNAQQFVRPIDLDGDGRQDLLVGPFNGDWTWFRSNGSQFENKGAIFNGRKTYGYYINGRGYGVGDGKAARVGDFDGDSMQDVLVGPDSSGNWGFLQSTGTGLVDRGDIGVGLYGNWAGSDSRTFLIDFNGDGRLDVLLGPDGGGNWYLLETSSEGCGSTPICLRDHGAVIHGAYAEWATESSRTHVLDVNGDGQQDVVLGPNRDGDWFWLIGTPTGFVDGGKLLTTPSGYGGWDSYGYRIRPIDLNGDGHPEIVLGPDPSGNWYWLQGTGRHMVDRGLLLSNAYAGWADSTDRIRVVDYNADGLGDLLIGPDGSGRFFGLRSVSTGMVDDGVIASTPYGAWDGSSARIRTMDVDGDGNSDVVIGPDASGKWYWLWSSAWSEAITQITSTGGTHSIRLGYSSLTDPNVYTKGSTAVYPRADVQPATRVVSSVYSGTGGFLHSGVGTTTRFRYGNLRVEYGTNARGLLGFEWTSSQQASGLVQKTTYRQDFPFLGLVASQQKLTPPDSSGRPVLLESNVTTYTCNNFVTPTAPGGLCIVVPGYRYFVAPSNSMNWGTDLNGASFPTVFKDFQYDAYGNATSVKTRTTQ